MNNQNTLTENQRFFLLHMIRTMSNMLLNLEFDYSPDQLEQIQRVSIETKRIITDNGYSDDDKIFLNKLKILDGKHGNLKYTDR